MTDIENTSTGEKESIPVEKKEEEVVKPTNKSPIIENLIEKGAMIVIISKSEYEATLFSLGLSLGFTRQGEIFNRFRCLNPTGVLFVDGANPHLQLETLLKSLKEEDSHHPFEIFSLDKKSKKENETALQTLLNKATWDDMVKKLIINSHEKAVVVYNNVTSLFQRVEDNLATTTDVLKWVIELRNKGVTQVFVVCNGKSGKGFQIPDQYIDIELKLTRINSAGNTVIRAEFEKARFIDPEEQLLFTLELVQGDEYKKVWVEAEIPDYLKASIIYDAYSNPSMTQCEIGKLNRRDQGFVSKTLSKAVDASLIVKNGKEIMLTKQGKMFLKSFGFNLSR